MKKYLQILILFCAYFFPFTTFAMMPVIDAAALVQLGNQLVVLKQQTQYIANELKQLKDNQYRWSDAQGLINNLGSVIQQTNGISYSASNFDQKFRQAYPGYQPAQDFSQQYKNNTNVTLNTLNGVMQSMGSSAADFQNENTRLQFLQQQAQSSQGQTQAIQSLSQIASEMVSQIQLLRQTVIAQSNAQSAYFANQIQNDASSKAEMEKVIVSGSVTLPPYGSGHPLDPPEF